ncbi:unnamed protein product [Arabidopsis lyrata]|nr:unnamed protein product [Arabidopsis lyrata]
MVFSHYLVDFFSTSDTSKTFHHHLGEPLLMLVLSQSPTTCSIKCLNGFIVLKLF